MMRAHVTRLALILAIGVLLQVDAPCAAPNKQIINISASAPIEADETAPGSQRRSLPWNNLTLTATADFDTTIPEEGFTDVSLTPGIWAAGLRLAARDEAMQDLSRQLARLPAAEALPGERVDMNLADFALRRTAVGKNIKEALEKETVETIRREPGGRTLLTLELPLQGVARLVLDQGGGFSPQAAISNDYGPRARAQSAAIAKVRDDLLRRILTEPLGGGETIADWVTRSQINRQRLIASIADARIVRSEARKTASGSDKWVMEIEYDLALFKKAILDQEKKTREYQKKLKSSAPKPTKTPTRK